MNFYELLYIARSDLTPSQIEDLNKIISNIIKGDTINENNNSSNILGNVINIDSWGIKSLAYKSKKLKRNKGHFCLITFSLSNLNILKELHTRLKLNEAILRFVIKKIDNSKITATKNVKQNLNLATS